MKRVPKSILTKQTILRKSTTGKVCGTMSATMGAYVSHVGSILPYNRMVDMV